MKKIVITGVTRGIGRAMAEEFARLDHVVIGCGRSHSQVDELRRRYPEPHHFHSVDISSDDEVKSWAGLVLAKSGAPDLLVNNAGVINRNAPLWEIGSDEFSRVVDTNLKGTASLIRYFLPSMLQRKTGVIVNITSGWGRSTDAEVAPYCATKWALEGLTMALAQELPSGMAAIPLNPGIINTDMLQSCFGSSASSYPSPREWAKTAVPFLLRLGPADNGRQLDIP